MAPPRLGHPRDGMAIDGHDRLHRTRWCGAWRRGLGSALIVCAVLLYSLHATPVPAAARAARASASTGSAAVFCGSAYHRTPWMLNTRGPAPPSTAEQVRAGAERWVRTRDRGRTAGWIGAVGSLLLLAGLRVRGTVRVRLGVDGVIVGSTRLARGDVDTVAVRDGRLVVVAGDRVVASPELVDPDALKPALAAWRRLGPVEPGGRTAPEIDRLRAIRHA